MLEQIKKEDSSISEREKRLQKFERIKERIAAITKKEELNQAEFDSYMKKLEPEESCKYCSGIKSVLNLCNNHLFKCEFRSNDKYKFEHGTRFECKREKMLKLKSLL
jgi:hypothetical protein